MTLLEKAKEMGFATAGKCPCNHGLASTAGTLEFCKTHSCKECWGREYVEYKTKPTQEAKADAGKPELDLTPWQIVRDITEVRMYGNAKYGDPDNWKTVELRRYINALLRHLLDFLEDNHSKDKESGIEHYKHMACNMAFICEMLRYGA
jgi:hypothetical protein